MEKHNMFFDEKLHKYTDAASSVYTSVTQLIHQYTPEFDKYGKALKCSRSKNSKYFGWNVSAILKDWESITKTSLDIGNATHNYLEDNIKKSSKYHSTYSSTANKIYTVEDIMDDLEVGNCSLESFKSFEMDILYPKVYSILEKLVNGGWKLFSEVCVFDKDLHIAGLLDLLIIHPQLGLFITGDWKTGKHDFCPYGDDNNKWKSGYYVKDSLGKQTAEYRFTEEYMLPPLHSFQSSTYVHYLIQTNIYTYLTKKITGLTPKGILISHINEHIRTEEGLATVKFYDVEYYEDVVLSLMYDFSAKNNKSQLKLSL